MSAARSRASASSAVLPMPGLALQHQGTAARLAGGVEQRPDRGPLGIATVQHL